MVNLQKLNTQLGFLNDGLQFGLDMLTQRGKGKNIGESLSYAGINLFNNAAATQNASELRAWTGSNLGYVAKNMADGDGSQALFNTTQASAQTYQLGLLGRWFGGSHCCPGANIWDMSMQNYNYNYTTPMWPGSGTFNQGMFRQGWFG